MRVMLVGFGGFVGSVMRYWMSGVVDDHIHEGLATLEKIDVRFYRSRPPRG